MAYAFWRNYVGQSRKLLAQAINFVYPPNTTWETDPIPTLSSIFPVEEMRSLAQGGSEQDGLNELESKALERFRELLGGKWYDIRKPGF